MPEYSEEHMWVGAVTLPLNLKQAKRAFIRHSVWLSGEEQKIEVLEVYCGQCRRPWEDVYDEPCIAATTSEHLRGGPIGERKKRKHDDPGHSCAVHGCDLDDIREAG